MEVGKCGPRAAAPGQTNYLDSFSPSALNATLITSEAAGAIIKAELNEVTAIGSLQTPRPLTSQANSHSGPGLDRCSLSPAGPAAPIAAQEHAGEVLPNIHAG